MTSYYEKTKQLILFMISLIIILSVLNVFQWRASHQVSARPAIVFAWSEKEGIFDDEVHFEAFKETVMSEGFIKNILGKPKHHSIREKFLPDWDPQVTRTKVSDLYENRILSTGGGSVVGSLS